ncbi:37S ribosomal protein MRP1 mitochondrial [Spathaspora sp. JA1]|nr:37S ribosomal protein MRP1 mitochondrial [Spathaspora sp. JA1]
MLRIASKTNTKIITSRSSSFLKSNRFISTFQLPENEILKQIKETNNSFKGLFSNRAIRELYFKRGQHLVDELNHNLESSSGNEIHLRGELTDIINQSMHNANLYQINKNASHLHSLEFFFDALRPVTPPKGAKSPVKEADPGVILETPGDDNTVPKMEPELVEWIEHSFGSIYEFRNLLINSAMGIKGDGMVWLVAESSMSKTYFGDDDKGLYHNLALVNTYNGGVIDDQERSGQMSRLKNYLAKKEAEKKEEQKPQEQLEMEQEEQNEDQEQSEVNEVQAEESEDTSDPLTLGTVQDAEYEHAFHNKKFVPALVIDASPRNYLLDYGVYGKQKYLENLWQCIDWSVVAKRLPPRAKQAISNF